MQFSEPLLQKYMTDHINKKTIYKQYKQYQIYLSKQSQTDKTYLTINEVQIIIGSKNYDEKTDIKFNITDLIGFNQEKINQKWSKISLNTFVKKKKIFRSQKRYLTHYNMFINKEQVQQQQFQNFKCNLLSCATNLQLKQSKIRPKFMIYFNPKSGSNSKKHFQNTIDFLRYTNFTFDVLQTKKRNHCLEHLNNQIDQKINQYKGIIIISGDGLMHQFVNSKIVGQIPVTHVPAGSGNAFSKYQTVLANQACEDYQAIYLAVKGNTKKMNLMQINLQNFQSPIFSFLSFQWCIMADLDMNSEFLRFLGGLRFQIYALWRLISLRKYKGIFSYSITSTDLSPLHEQIKDNINFKKSQQVYLHKLISFIPFLSTKYQFSPLLKLEDQAMDMQIIKQSSGRWQLAKYLLNSDSGSHFDKIKQLPKQGFKFQWAKIKSFRLQPNGQDKGIFGIDGQKYQSQKIQAKLSNKKVLIFA